MAYTGAIWADVPEWLRRKRGRRNINRIIKI